MAKIILLADNNLDYLDSRAEMLEESGYTVIKASSPEEARKVLEENYVHLALLDIRLRNDKDDKDLSGIQLARDTTTQLVPKIMITSYPSYDYVRAALGPSTDGQPPAVDFIYKEEGFDSMVKTIELVFQTRLQINEALQIRWADEQPLTFPGLVAKIESGLQVEHLSSRIQEIEDLFRKLFSTAEQITLSQQLWSVTGRTLLDVLVYSNGKEEQVLVTVGKLGEVENERERFGEYAPHTLHAGSLALLGQKETIHFGATAWSLIATGLGVEGLTSFTSYYKSHTEKQARSVLENIFQETLPAWIGQNRTAEERPLAQVYLQRFRKDDLVPTVDDFTNRMRELAREGLQRGLPEAVFDTDQLQFRFANGRFLGTRNPLPYLSANQLLPKMRALVGSSFGGLDPDTLLVDSMNRNWISDFAYLSPAPVWLDYTGLECELRFKLIDAGNLQDLYDLEKCFLGATRLGDVVSIDGINPEFHKLAVCIQTIRSQAISAIGDDLAPYELSLLFCAARKLITFNPQQKRRNSETETFLYRLLLCGLLAEKLCQTSDPADLPDVYGQVSNSLRIDEDNHDVRIGGRTVDLTLREYDLLLYLYQRSGTLCKRGEIVHQVFGIQEDSNTDAENLLNTNISRLRRKIEPDPDHPVYLETVRGIGFKLILPPE
jgi:DNA-binding response OmpR family regulator